MEDSNRSHPSFKSSADMDVSVIRESLSIYPCILRILSACQWYNILNHWQQFHTSKKKPQRT